MRLWTLSDEEINRLELVQMVCAKRLSVTAAAKEAGLGRQRMSQLVNAYRRHGASTLASGRRGKPANNKLPEELRIETCALIREHYHDFGPTLAAEYLFERHSINVWTCFDKVESALGLFYHHFIFYWACIADC